MNIFARNCVPALHRDLDDPRAVLLAHRRQAVARECTGTPASFSISLKMASATCGSNVHIVRRPRRVSGSLAFVCAGCGAAKYSGGLFVDPRPSWA